VLGLERPTAGGVLGLALALGGVALVVGGGLGSGGRPWAGTCSSA
jgi:drug/metabolite transporter (DMT)-like permease